VGNTAINFKSQKAWNSAMLNGYTNQYPLSMPGNLGLWVDASKEEGNFRDYSGGTGPEKDRWWNRFGSDGVNRPEISNTSSTLANMSIFTANQINGRPGLVFDNSTDTRRMQSANPSNAEWVNPGAHTHSIVFAVFSTLSDITNLSAIWELGGVTAGTNIWLNAGTLYCSVFESSSDYTGASWSASVNTPYILVRKIDDVARTVDWWLNGVKTSVDISTWGANPSSGTGQLSWGMFGGNSRDNDYVAFNPTRTHCAWGEMIIAEGYQYSDAEVDDVIDNYLAPKWGITV
jgi:hypothetical protein